MSNAVSYFINHHKQEEMDVTYLCYAQKVDAIFEGEKFNAEKQEDEDFSNKLYQRINHTKTPVTDFLTFLEREIILNALEPHVRQSLRKKM